MSMTIPVAQLRITRELREAEAALDDALLRQSALLTTLVASRRQTGSEPFLGHEALLRLAKSQHTLLSAGSDLARVHGGLQEVQKKVVGYLPCPENEPMGFEGNDDQAVA